MPADVSDRDRVRAGRPGARSVWLAVWRAPKALYAMSLRWLVWRRVCAWCWCRVGGNPWAARTSHGICGRCLNRSIKLLIP